VAQHTVVHCGVDIKGCDCLAVEMAPWHTILSATNRKIISKCKIPVIDLHIIHFSDILIDYIIF